MYGYGVCCGTRNTRLRTPNVKHEARGAVRASEHGRTDAGKSNSRASDLPYNAVRFVRRPVLFEVGSEREQEILVERSARSLQ